MKRLLLPLYLLCSILKLNAQIDTIAIPSVNWSLSTAKSMIVDNVGNLWLSHYGSGTAAVMMYDGTAWTNYQTSNSGLPSDAVNAMLQDNNGNYWFGTTAGLTKFDGTNWSTYTSSNSGLDSNRINCITIDNSNDLWIGTPAGLQKFDGTNWTSFNSSNSQLNSNNVRCLAIANGYIYIGTDYGLSVLSTGNIQNFAPLYNLSEIVISGNEIWLRNANSICRFLNGIYEPLDDLAGNCLSIFIAGINSGSLTFAPGVNGGVTFINDQGIGHLNNNLYTPISLGPSTAKVIKKGTDYYVLSMLPPLGTRAILKVNEPQLNLTPVPISSYYTDCWEQNLDINQVQARVLDKGDMFWDIQSNPKYEVPKGSGSMTTFAASIWLGGKVNGQLRTACQTYRQNGIDFWPGSLDTVTAHNAPTLAMGPVIKVNRFDIENFIYNYNNGNVQAGNFTPSYGILNWPASDTGNFSRNKAPYVDVNHNGTYDPLTGGDYPAIKGDQMLYNIYNDASDQHTETQGTSGAMGLEIRQKSYAYSCDGIADSMKALNYTTFYEFEIINRSDTLIDSMYISYWHDVDLGNYSDDYIGCNVEKNYGYVYNGDNYDEDANGVTGYHNNLPCFATAIMESPFAMASDGKDNNHNGVVDEPYEDVGMSSFIQINSSFDSLTGRPSAQQHYYNYMKGVWKDGSTIKYGANGTTGTQGTTFIYPGSSDPFGYGVGGSPSNPLPQASWTEVSAGNAPYDRMFVMGSGPFQLAAKDTTRIVYALVFTQVGSSNNFAAIPQNELDVKRIKDWYTNNNFPSCLDLSTVGIKTAATNELTASLYPNPANNTVTISLEELQSSTSLEIIDVIGSTLLKKQLVTKTETLNIEQLPPGVYLVRVKSTNSQRTFKLVVSR